MFLFYIALGCLVFWRSGFRDSSDNGYISRESCMAVKGVFIILVFLRHIYPYVIQAGGRFGSLGKLDYGYFLIDVFLAQLIVVMFLFYSGFGVMESIKSKGLAYVMSMPKRRMLTTILNLDVAVVIFLISDLILNRCPRIDTLSLAFLGWSSVGDYRQF